MKGFFDNKVLLDNEIAEKLYATVKDLPIIDYHCHLSEKQIAENVGFENIGQAWLAGDHYKWRAMRMCGVDEYYITGGASYKEKFIKYAEILPKLIGGPLYYWSHLELKQIFGVNKVLNADTAEEIWAETETKIKSLPAQTILKNFNIEYIATTDEPIFTLDFHGDYNGTKIRPTYRPDKILTFDASEIAKLSECVGYKLDSLSELKRALEERVAYFVSKGCRIADHGFADFPEVILSDSEADAVYANLADASDEDKSGLFGNMMVYLFKVYREHNILLQLHFSVTRNVNKGMFAKIGVDSGYDVMTAECNYSALMNLLDSVSDDERPNIVMYSLNPNATPVLANISGAFRNVVMGAAWWFNDTLEGIKLNLSQICEYACLGTNLGMLTDSRSLLSYSRFDFFRRILCSFVADLVVKGEYNESDAYPLVADICYNNIKKLI